MTDATGETHLAVSRVFAHSTLKNRRLSSTSDDEPLFNTNTLPTHGMGQTTRLPLLKLAEVFDFSNTHWLESVQSAQENSFEKELEFYELLDLDAE